jgi:hypothetical protein
VPYTFVCAVAATPKCDQQSEPSSEIPNSDYRHATGLLDPNLGCVKLFDWAHADHFVI